MESESLYHNLPENSVLIIEESRMQCQPLKPSGKSAEIVRSSKIFCYSFLIYAIPQTMPSRYRLFIFFLSISGVYKIFTFCEYPTGLFHKMWITCGYPAAAVVFFFHNFRKNHIFRDLSFVDHENLIYTHFHILKRTPPKSDA